MGLTKNVPYVSIEAGVFPHWSRHFFLLSVHYLLNTREVVPYIMPETQKVKEGFNDP